MSQMNGKVRAECEYPPRDGDCLIGASSPIACETHASVWDHRHRLQLRWLFFDALKMQVGRSFTGVAREPEVLRPLASLIPVRRYLILQRHSYNPGIGIAV
jgi:hypothetical protein